MKTLMLVATLFVSSIAYLEVSSSIEASMTPYSFQLTKANEQELSVEKSATEGGYESEDEPAVAKQVIPLQSVPDGQGARALLQEANRELSLVQKSTYSHKTQVDESIGQFNYDCSGFLKYALSYSVPAALSSLQEATVRRPLAKHFVSFITSLPPGKVVDRWRRLERATDLTPGDIIAWLKPPDVVSNNTGHVMIVREAIQQSPKHSNEIIVPIIDSTGSRHGYTDSRNKVAATGLGTGSIVLVLDHAGRPISYRWSQAKNSRKHNTQIALAHLE